MAAGRCEIAAATATGWRTSLQHTADVSADVRQRKIDCRRRSGAGHDDAGHRGEGVWNFFAAAACYATVRNMLNSVADPSADMRADLDHNLAGLHYARGEFRAAEHHARQAVNRRRVYPNCQPFQLAADEAVLAAVLAAQHRGDEARQIFGRVLEVTEEHYGSSHYEVAVVLSQVVG